MRTTRQITTLLDRIDWNFPGSNTFHNTVHALHYFPGNYIPQIPAHLIQILSDEGHVVYDPFCGSGTTGVEAIRLGRQSLQSDINRTSVLISEAKLIAFTDHKIGQDLFNLLDEIMLSNLLTFDKFKYSTDNSSKIERWFHKHTYNQLSFLWDKIRSYHRRETRIVLEMLFSDTLFACASTSGSLTSTGGKRRHHWGWIADNVIPKIPVYQDAIALFRNRLIHTTEAINMGQDKARCTYKVFRSDARETGLQDACIDLIITSPPYIGMIDYALANRLHYLWKEWPLDDDKGQEIGARFKRNKKNLRDEYTASMKVTANEFKRILKPGSYCAVVIGASRKYPEVANEVVEIFSNFLKLTWGPQIRNVSKRRISEKRGTEITELICVYKNQ